MKQKFSGHHYNFIVFKIKCWSIEIWHINSLSRLYVYIKILPQFPKKENFASPSGTKKFITFQCYMRVALSLSTSSERERLASFITIGSQWFPSHSQGTPLPCGKIQQRPLNVLTLHLLDLILYKLRTDLLPKKYFNKAKLACLPHWATYMYVYSMWFSKKKLQHFVTVSLCNLCLVHLICYISCTDMYERNFLL